MQYAELAGFFERLEATSGRLEMTSILVEMLARVKPAEMESVVRLLSGAVAPDWEGLEVGLAEKQILKVLAQVSGASSKSEADAERIQKLYHDKGDLGLAAEEVLSKHGGRKQASLFGPGERSVNDVHRDLVAIARTSGKGSQETKQRLFAKLLTDSTPLEARYITRTVAGRLRLGVADMTFLDALASWKIGRGVRSVTDMEEDERKEQTELRAVLERAFDLRSDVAVVAAALARGGPDAVAALGVEPGIPLRPMAAERLKTLPEILEKMNGHVAMEYKYDGLRMQIHRSAAGDVRLFSRRMEEMTPNFPDVVARIKAAFPKKDFIIEAEAVAVDEDGRLRPFQEISSRRGRKTDLEQAVADVPVTLFAFDCLALGGKEKMHLGYSDRRAALSALLDDRDEMVKMSTMQEAKSVDEMEAFFQRAVEDGAEGIMCKDPAAPYKAGSRGFAWIKFKTDYTEALVDTMDLVAIGAFYGRGRRAGWYGALLMAAFDPESKTWQSVCKLGTGFDDATLMGLKERFEKFVVAEKPKEVDSGLEPDVWFSPKIVMEVQAAELTLSPTHRAGWGLVRPGAGFASRFPRFTGKWRDDKGPKDATTVKELQSMFAQQPGR